MKIEESGVVLKGKHRLESEHSMATFGKSSFRTVLESAAEAAEATETAATDRADPGERVRMLLQRLIAEILALLSGQARPESVDIREAIRGDGKASPGEVSARSPQVREIAWENTKVETVSEHESTDFSASGVIRTADGKSIDFSLDLTMSRDFQSASQATDSGTVVLRDPLVINFDGKAVELADTRFNFDLDADGNAESIHGLARGSAFLVLDRNGDGRINDGREVFGAGSGDGFADLALLDDDKNHWIDEADAAFASLQAWSRDAEGKDCLSSLKACGVGALYLGAAETPFALKDEGNRLRGEVRASGIYLREDGRAGTLQQVDLAV